MCYRCEVCEYTVPSGISMRRHIIYRPDCSVRRELAVCEGCAARRGHGRCGSRTVASPPRPSGRQPDTTDDLTSFLPGPNSLWRREPRPNANGRT